jgi:hypothetical protein
MTQLGVFRDDYYSPYSVLPEIQFTSTSQASGVIAASALAGASENYISTSGATALTTDTAANIAAQVISAIQKAAVGAFPPPNIVGLTFTTYVRNTNGSTLTLSAGTGVTITGTATLATLVERQYMVTVNSPTSVTLQDLGGSVLQ